MKATDPTDSPMDDKFKGMTYEQAIKAGWKLLSKEDHILYNPNLVSRRIRILSA